MRDRFEMLFTHNVDGVFFMKLDEPFRWDASADRDALLDYAFTHLRVTEVNDALCEQLGVTREALIGTVPRDRWSDDPQTWRARMTELYDSGHLKLSDRAPKSNGGWYDTEGVYVCLYDEQGRITGHFGTQRDVTEKLKAAERLELATAAAGVGVWDMDLTGVSIYFERPWIERLGYSPEDPATRNVHWWTSLVHDSHLAEVSRAFLEHVSGKTPYYRVEYRLRAANGEWVWVMSNGRVSHRAPDDSPMRMVGVTFDITERKHMQERLFLSERMASLGTLAAGVAHEINNPLTYMVLNLTLIERELDRLALASDTQARLRSMIEQARCGTERVSSIVRDLQALTSIPDQGVTDIDIVNVLARCLELADYQIRPRARVIRELTRLPPVRGHEGRIIQLFLNLLLNAAQAIPEAAPDKQWIRVTTSLDRRHAVIEIADSGIGIAPDVIGRIFDPFFTTKPVGQGSGLGLAICRNIVNAMAGEISVDTGPGHGSTFRVRLPVS